ncbi:hypothetical protein [Roseateles sp.]|uniref:hypothetical protein n=1 Tax=Roseateles sp. TaxID=1971397 RepID=UPI00286A7BDD|nr:hypothetical protein [Roseateles sp.]
MSADALVRRRLLLKGAGTGAATLAALTPIGALAQTQSTVFVCKNGTGKDVMCTVSGVQSAAHSFGPNITKVTAGGKGVAYWGAAAPAVTPKPGVVAVPTPLNTWPAGVTPTALVKTVFGSGAAYANTGLFAMTNRYASQDMAHWIAAYLNAKAMPASFPYKPAEVVALYTDTTKRVAALAFFKGYLENLA